MDRHLVRAGVRKNIVVLLPDAVQSAFGHLPLRRLGAAAMSVSMNPHNSEH
jgi:hypothetical protein